MGPTRMETGGAGRTGKSAYPAESHSTPGPSPVFLPRSKARFRVAGR